MVSLTDNGKILYRATRPNCIAFPKGGDPELDVGIPRNYEMFDPLDFLAAVTQHIPNKGEHQIRYYGWYSNKRRGMRKNDKGAASASGTYGPDDYWQQLETDTDFRRKCRMSQAALIKCVYEVHPLKCPVCSGTMKVISFIERNRSDVIEKILRHCGIWKETPIRAPPCEVPALEPTSGFTVDYEFISTQLNAALQQSGKLKVTSKPLISRERSLRELFSILAFYPSTHLFSS